MPSLVVDSFSRGMDRRRPRVAGTPGSLWDAKNCVLTRGGDIEACKKWVAEYSLPAGTFGLASVNGSPYVFGTAATPGGMPTDVVYKRLTYGGAATITAVLDAKPFNNQFYVIAEFDDGDIQHFYNGALVTEWQTRAGTLWDYTTVASRLAEKINARSDVSAKVADATIRVSAAVAGTGFTISTATTDDAAVPGSLPTATKTTVQANVAGVAEVRATATITITGGTVSKGVNQVSQIAVGVSNLLASPVDFVLDNSGTASAIALAITSAAVAGYTASAVGNVVTILAPPGLGATINGTAPAVTLTGNVTRSQTSFAGGVTAVTAVTQVEKIVISATSADAKDVWSITVNGTTYKVMGRASGHGQFCHVYARRVWSPVGRNVAFCKLKDPTVWTTTASAATDPGVIDTSQDSEGNDDIISIEEHNGNTGFFSENSVRVYSLDTDATAIKLIQSLPNTGSVATKLPLQYGNSDVYYMSMSGLRSMRSRVGYNYAFAEDVVSSLSPYLVDWMNTIGSAVARKAQAVIDPRDGRMMLSMGSKVFVLNDFPDTSTRGWTYIEPGFTIEDLKQIGRSVMARVSNTIYVYGGLAGTTYPAANELPITVKLPFLAGSDPATFKNEGGYDMAGTGDWVVTILIDPNDETASINVGTINFITYPENGVDVPGRTTHWAPELTCASGGKVTLSSITLSLNKVDAA